MKLKKQFEQCKQDLVSAALLSYLNPELPLSLHTDAPHFEIDATLRQYENKKWNSNFLFQEIK